MNMAKRILRLEDDVDIWFDDKSKCVIFGKYEFHLPYIQVPDVIAFLQEEGTRLDFLGEAPTKEGDI